MNYLKVVQEAMRNAGVREDVPTSLVDQNSIVTDFATWVASEYRALQTTSHGDRWFWRQAVDQTVSLVDGTNSYSLPAGIADVNWNTCRVYTTQYSDESYVDFIDYPDFKMSYLTKTFQEGRPRFITITPAGGLIVSPTPDQSYTLAFDGISDIDSLEPLDSSDASFTSENATNTDTFLVPEEFQWLLVWGAVKRFAKHHEDSAKLADAQSEYRPFFDAMVNRQTPNSRVVVGSLYGTRRLYGS